MRRASGHGAARARGASRCGGAVHPPRPRLRWLLRLPSGRRALRPRPIGWRARGSQADQARGPGDPPGHGQLRRLPPSPPRPPALQGAQPRPRGPATGLRRIAAAAAKPRGGAGDARCARARPPTRPSERGGGDRDRAPGGRPCAPLSVSGSFSRSAGRPQTIAAAVAGRGGLVRSSSRRLLAPSVPAGCTAPTPPPAPRAAFQNDRGTQHNHYTAITPPTRTVKAKRWGARRPAPPPAAAAAAAPGMGRRCTISTTVVAGLLAACLLAAPGAAAPLRGAQLGAGPRARPARRLAQSGYMQSAPLYEDQAAAAVQRRPTYQPGWGGGGGGGGGATPPPKAGRGYPGPAAYSGYWGRRRMLAQPDASARCVCAFDFDNVSRPRGPARAAWMPHGGWGQLLTRRARRMLHCAARQAPPPPGRPSRPGAARAGGRRPAARGPRPAAPRPSCAPPADPPPPTPDAARGARRASGPAGA
jgi:hypothetical protein